VHGDDGGVERASIRVLVIHKAECDAGGEKKNGHRHEQDHLQRS
jgi:hypothetical protein